MIRSRHPDGRRVLGDFHCHFVYHFFSRHRSGFHCTSVLLINTKIWFAYPMSYPFYLLMVEYGRSAAGVYERQIAWLPWLPAAVSITVIALGIACMRFGAAERR